MSITRALPAALLAVALLATGCSSTESEAAPEEQETTTAAEPTPEPAPSEECLDVPKTLLRAIAKGANDATIKPVSGAAVKSRDYSKVYMIAMEFNGLGSPERGVWASNSLKRGGGVIMSVDGIAKEFTVWPNGPADSPMSITDDGAQEALDCL